MNLTKKQRLFCEEYVGNYYNAYQAAISAGYAESTAKKASYRWVGKNRKESEFPEMYDYVQNLIADWERRSGLSPIRTARVLIDILEAEDSSNSDKIRAAAELNKMMGAHAPEKYDHTTKGEPLQQKQEMDLSELTDEELKTLISIRKRMDEKAKPDV